MLMFTLTAQAQSLRRGASTTSAPTILSGVPTGVDPATASTPADPPPVQEFSLGGAGTENFNEPSSVCLAAGLTCNGSDTCQCKQATGSLTTGVGPFLAGSFTYTENVDLSHNYPNGSNNVCFFASGVLSVSPGGGSVINFITSGASCNWDGGGTALFSGGFAVGTSTGGFASAFGGGDFAYSSNFSTDMLFFDLRGVGGDLN
jgi:hypothetical protein